MSTAYTAPEGSASCTQCKEDYYMLLGEYELNGYKLNGECLLKPDGADVSKAGTTLETMVVLEGYYRFTRTSVKVRHLPSTPIPRRSRL